VDCQWIRQGLKVGFWAEFCAALWQNICSVERDAFEKNFKPDNEKKRQDYNSVYLNV
jgi:hypothetical protein